ncbi:MAG: DUF3754 domain-containing protein [Ignavibacteriales bacterium]|nr:DUF3754 domain-containing protein [Ignavibacteriales bacterium]
MKTKRIFYFLFLLLPYLQQSSAQIDTAQKRQIEKTVAEALVEREYTRIPNKDFDDILTNKVSAKITEKLTFWVTLMGIIVAAIGGLAAYTFNTKIKQLITDQIKSESENQFQRINKYIVDSRKYTLRSDLEVIRAKFTQSPYSELPVMQAKTLLLEIKELKNPDLLAEIVDLLAIMYYTKRTPKEVEKLIENNEKDCEIKETTYMNAAILYMDLYELDGSKWYKENSLKYCDAAAKKVPHYGEPQGIMLLLCAIDYVTGAEQQDKEKALETARDILKEILKGSDALTAFSTVNRLERDLQSKTFSKYIKELVQVLSEEFKELYQRSSQYKTRASQALA